MSRISGLIVLEGIDGAGTTSQLAPVAQALRARGHEVVITKEPSEGDVGQLVRAELGAGAPLGEASMALLFAADRLAHLEQEVWPATRRGALVLCDRYLWSSFAYQSAALPPSWVQDINRLAPSAQLNVWLSCDERVAKERRLCRGGATERYDDDARQREAHKRYEALAQHASEAECLRVDANQDIAVVTEEIVAGILSRLGQR